MGNVQKRTLFRIWLLLPHVSLDPMSLREVSQVMKREKLLDMLDGGQLNSKLTLKDIQKYDVIILR